MDHETLTNILKAERITTICDRKQKRNRKRKKKQVTVIGNITVNAWPRLQASLRVKSFSVAQHIVVHTLMSVLTPGILIFFHNVDWILNKVVFIVKAERENFQRLLWWMCNLFFKIKPAGKEAVHQNLCVTYLSIAKMTPQEGESETTNPSSR